MDFYKKIKNEMFLTFDEFRFCGVDLLFVLFHVDQSPCVGEGPAMLVLDQLFEADKDHDLTGSTLLDIDAGALGGHGHLLSDPQ